MAKKQAKKKRKTAKENKSPSSSMSKATVYRRLGDITGKLPSFTKAYTTVIDKLISNVTPRKQNEIRKKGISKRKVFSKVDKKETEST